MSTAISMSDFTEALAVNFAAGVPVMLMGASGIGKTEMADGLQAERRARLRASSRSTCAQGHCPT